MMSDGKKKYILLKPYAPWEIADIYDVDRRTLNKWLEPFLIEIGPRQGRFYTIAQVKVIFTKLSIPGIIMLE